jgi:hypothetical protein
MREKVRSQPLEGKRKRRGQVRRIAAAAVSRGRFLAARRIEFISAS